MRTGIFLEYVGDVATDLLLKNMTSTNGNSPSIDAFRDAFPAGFTLAVQIEQEIHETPDERTELSDLAGKLRRAGGYVVPGRKMVGLVLSPK